MPFTTNRSALDSGVVVLALSGTMTMGTQLQQFEWAVEELAKNKQNKVVLDMSLVTYLDSSAIGVLVASTVAVRDSGGQLRLAGVTDRVSMIFRMTGIDSVLKIDTTKDEAVSTLTLGA